MGLFILVIRLSDIINSASLLLQNSIAELILEYASSNVLFVGMHMTKTFSLLDYGTLITKQNLNLFIIQNKSHHDFVSSSEVIKTIEISNQFRANNQFPLALKCLEDLNKGQIIIKILLSMAITYSYGNFALNNHNHILSINCLEKATFYLDKKKTQRS